MNTGLLILRLFVGLALGAHGAQKLFGWWGGSGVAVLRQHMTRMRLRPASLWVAGAIGAELGGGLLLAAGLLSPLGSVGVGAAMLMAIALAHWGKGFFAPGGGVEVPLLYLIPAAALGIIGPGSYSLNSLFGITLPEPPLGSSPLRWPSAALRSRWRGARRPSSSRPHNSLRDAAGLGGRRASRRAAIRTGRCLTLRVDRPRRPRRQSHLRSWSPRSHLLPVRRAFQTREPVFRQSMPPPHWV